MDIDTSANVIFSDINIHDYEDNISDTNECNIGSCSNEKKKGPSQKLFQTI